MTDFTKMDDKELAYLMEEWKGSALLRWSDFTEKEKLFFRNLQDEIIRRFISEKSGETMEDEEKCG